ncbi:DUF2177 family protein [Mitsuaria sp. GD03876]|uniref:DUF2177 family protein n=1 Tax=Mitsuaria sp. GD03876 TaxID=2975399 RepID=UPI002448CE31|nr:DUF2177 family protein [Mitsuaria sp. GD03876]MDH0863824.1 DUF2177 family protein [Mitsuaria sp. GD03876]
MTATDSTIPTRAPAWRWPLAYLATAAVFLTMDAGWLSATSASLYQPAIGHLMAATVDWRAVAAFYPLYIAGLVVFAVAPALSSEQGGRNSRATVWPALWRGAFFGLLAYATYDFTNQATLRDWPWTITLIDLAWGATVSGIASAVGAAATAATCRRARRTSAR